MAIKTFQRGSAVYKCNSCGRSTRNTGDEGNSRLCYECYELAGIDNEISDNGGMLTEDSYTKPAYVVELLTTLRNKHGINLHNVWGNTYVAQFIEAVGQ